jgi:hypothetical protein
MINKLSTTETHEELINKDGTNNGYDQQRHETHMIKQRSITTTQQTNKVGTNG